MYKYGPVQKKIMIVLLGGLALGLTRSPRQYFRTLRAMKKEWSDINQQNFNRSVKSLVAQKLVEEKKLPDGSFVVQLTKEGRKQANVLNVLGVPIYFDASKRWDGKWRVVLFDIPEKNRAFRDILRDHLRTLEFIKLQHSVFVSPHPFEKQILELVALYSASPYVRVITADKIDNEDKLKKYFKLNV